MCTLYQSSSSSPLRRLRKASSQARPLTAHVVALVSPQVVKINNVVRMYEKSVQILHEKLCKSPLVKVCTVLMIFASLLGHR